MLDKKGIDLIKNLTEAFGPSGFEREVSLICKKYMEPYKDDVITDNLGSVTFVAKGTSERPNILMTGHVDEIGFIVSSIDEKTGFLTFNTLGGWWDQVLLGHRVIIRTKKQDVTGIIAAKPPHILSEEDRKKILLRKDMFIDIGATNEEEAIETGVRVGDPVIPWSPFNVIQNGKVAIGKAFDDRIGSFVIMEAIRKIKENEIEHPNTIYGSMTAQEEVGLRGAQTTAYSVKPDVGIILETDIAGDIPGVKPSEAPPKIGKGPSLTTWDRSMIPNQPMKEFVIETAEEAQIPLQLSGYFVGGGTDAGKVHLDRAGCPSVVIGIPTRHIHSHNGVISLEDVENAISLIIELTKRLDMETVKSFTII